MNLFKRGMLSISRKPIKSVILFLLLFILGSLMSGALSIHQAVYQTEGNLMAKLPAVVTLTVDSEELLNHYEETGEQLNIEPLTPEMVHEIGNLPYVNDYDFTIEYWDMLSHNLIRTLELSIDTEDLGDEWEQFLIRDNDSFLTQGNNIERFNMKGISNPEITDIKAGLIELNEGSLFTQDDIDHANPVALISKSLAQTNDLTIGSRFVLEAHVYDYSELSVVSEKEYYNEEYIFAIKNYEFEVIGIFEPTGEISPANTQAILDNRELQNQIYVPLPIVHDAYTFQTDANMEIYGESARPETEISQWFNTFFLLHDPQDLPAFTRAATEILPEYWITLDLTYAFSEILVAMDFMLWIADLMLLGGAVAIIVITSLLVTLFLKDRKHELGILLALGERKYKIISQIIFEVLSIALIAMTFSFVSGNLLSRGISRQMLENQLLEAQEETFDDSIYLFPGLNPGKMSTDEMLEAYDVTLEPQTLIIYFSAGLGIIILSTMIPIIYTLNLNPKKILM